MFPGPSVQGFIIAVTALSVVMGVYIASFLLCLRWLVFADKGGTLRKGINWILLIITIVIFDLSATAYLIFLSSTVSKISKGRSIDNLNTTFVGLRHSTIYPSYESLNSSLAGIYSIV